MDVDFYRSGEGCGLGGRRGGEGQGVDRAPAAVPGEVSFVGWLFCERVWDRLLGSDVERAKTHGGRRDGKTYQKLFGLYLLATSTIAIAESESTG